MIVGWGLYLRFGFWWLVWLGFGFDCFGYLCFELVL